MSQQHHLRSPSPDWGYLLDSLCRTPGIHGAIATSSDGMLQAHRGLDQDVAETLAASTSGLSSLANATARVLGQGVVTRNLIEYERGYLFVDTVTNLWVLAVVTGPDADLGQVGFEMNRLAEAVGGVLEPAARGPRAG
ncbi:roadblock/LC7 domain-containing protein [Dactylosporangium sp. NPDC005572]|uniref:roadblock/LC7 domain-containing protein n=1 Tax=Dactylosporangium sp. NPDC005572 TaxID=3156889 RepID=UPI0033BEA715